MPVTAMIFLGVFLAIFAILDIILLVSLLAPGDERKASSLTLLGTVGSLILEVIENFVRAQPMSINPFVHLEVIAIIYFIFLLYYRKRYGG